jgi:hypothetical protein
LRNPAKRAESLFLHHLRKGRVSANFSEAIRQFPRIKESGKYRTHLSRWFQYFHTEQIKITLTEDMAQNPEKVLLELYEFLSVDQSSLPENLHQKVNTAGMPKHPWLAKYAARAVAMLNDNKMHKIVDLGKSLGLKKIYSGSEKIPFVSTEEKKKLLLYYEKDIQFVEELLQRKLDFWRVLE